MDTVTQELKALMGKPAKKAGLPPFVLDESLYPIEQENQVIDYLWDNWVNNDKKVVRMVKHIYPAVPRFIQRSLLDVLLTVADPKKMICEYVTEKKRWTEVIEQLISEGNHGVIYDDVKTYGFEVEANARWLKEDDKWSIEQEKEIIDESIIKWCKARGYTRFKGKVMMFHHFGFSGMSYFFNCPID